MTDDPRLSRARVLRPELRTDPVGIMPDLPAQNITWTRAIELANALSKREGLQPCYATSPSGRSFAAAWSGAWRFSTLATESRRSDWVGATADYDVDISSTGCDLRGSATKFQGVEQAGSFTFTGVIDGDGDVRIDYTRHDGAVSGTWQLTRDGVGTFESSAGDVSGHAHGRAADP